MDGFREYSDIEIQVSTSQIESLEVCLHGSQQMMGRAGRPQYDKFGVVVVMCDMNKVSKVGTKTKERAHSPVLEY